jgi:hypothetical protein
MRKVMAHAFAESSLREQESIIHSYCDLLIKRLYDQIEGPSKGNVDIVAWLNFTTFDIIGDLAFGESFGGLERGDYHPWISTIFDSLKVFIYTEVMDTYRPLAGLLRALLGMVPSIAKGISEHTEFTRVKVMKRLAKETERRDFMT